jgi:mandelate racemase/muconate lactonizing enzyme-like protein
MSPLPAEPVSSLSEPLTIRSVDAMLVMAPMRRPLGTSAMRITEAPLVLVDLRTEEGITGRAYLFSYLESAGHAAISLTRDASAVLAGTSAAPAAVRRLLEARFKLLGARGLASAVLAGVDVACWDALAIAAGLPLARMLGATMRPTAAYNSNGLSLVEPRAAADEALELVAEGFRAIKMRLDRPSGHDDLAAARERCRRLDDEGPVLDRGTGPPRRLRRQRRARRPPAHPGAHRRRHRLARRRGTGRRGQTSLSMASLVRGPLLRIPLTAPGEKLL